MWKWCVKTSLEIVAHVLPKFRFERCESRDREGIVNMWFRHAHPRHCEHVISSRSFLTWGEHKQLPVMFSAHNNFSPCIFPLLYFFYEHLRRLCIIYSAQLHFLQNTKNKKTRNWKGKAGVLETYSYLFFSLHYFFLWTFTKILYSFCFYPIAFCTGINTKTKKKLEIEKGRQ